MGRKQRFECVECEAIFKISHDMDSSYYDINYCPFCGSDVSENQEDEYGEDEDLS